MRGLGVAGLGSRLREVVQKTDDVWGRCICAMKVAERGAVLKV